MAELKYDLSLAEAIDELTTYASEYLPESEQVLEGLDLHTAFVLGAQTLLHRLKEITGPDPLEVDTIHFVVAEDGTPENKKMENDA